MHRVKVEKQIMKETAEMICKRLPMEDLDGERCYKLGVFVAIGKGARITVFASPHGHPNRDGVIYDVTKAMKNGAKPIAVGFNSSGEPEVTEWFSAHKKFGKERILSAVIRTMKDME